VEWKRNEAIEVSLIKRIYGGVVGVLTAYLGKEKMEVLEKFQFGRNWRDLDSQQSFLTSLSKKLNYKSIFSLSSSLVAFLLTIRINGGLVSCFAE
jgi:hypothetical protein